MCRPVSACATGHRRSDSEYACERSHRTFAATSLASWPMLLPDPTVAVHWQTLNYVATAVVGICTVIVYSLAFLPPAWYRRWVGETGPAGSPRAA